MMSLNVPKDKFWHVRECKCGQGYFEVYRNEDCGEVVTGRMSFSEAYQIARDANNEILLAARPTMHVSGSALQAAKGGDGA